MITVADSDKRVYQQRKTCQSHSLAVLASKVINAGLVTVKCEGYLIFCLVQFFKRVIEHGCQYFRENHKLHLLFWI